MKKFTVFMEDRYYLDEIAECDTKEEAMAVIADYKKKGYKAEYSIFDNETEEEIIF